jgi:hypothetical protein
MGRPRIELPELPCGCYWKSRKEPVPVCVEGKRLEREMVAIMDDGLPDKRERWDVAQQAFNQHFLATPSLQSQLAAVTQERDRLREAEESAVTLPDEMTPAIRDALGIMNFQSGPVAHLFRAAGYRIKPKCEEEQAFVLFWALKLAIQHGDGWREAATAELRALRDQVVLAQAARKKHLGE